MGAWRTARVGRAGGAGPALLGAAALLPQCAALRGGGAAGDGCYVGGDRTAPRGRIADDAAITARANARCVRGAPAR